MGTLSYGMNISLDGYINDSAGGIDWTDPDPDQHQYWNDFTATLALSLYGRTLWNLMAAYWPTADQDPDADPVTVDFARRWRAVPKVVFSRGPLEVSGNARVERGDVVEVTRRLKAETDGQLEVGGATIAAPLLASGLVDELRMVVLPILLGGGTPVYPALTDQQRFELVETRQFRNGAVLMHYLRR